MKLSVAMIVRDEEAMLPGCLAALGPCELVVVDTGSNDRTKELATKAGARVFDFEWCDDFSAARNFALEHCTGEWVVVLDADERVSRELWRELEQLPDSAGAATVLMRNVQAHGHVRDARLLRVFRRDGAIRFRHPIHEDVTPSVSAYLEATGQKLVELDGVVEHLGYTREHMLARGKRQRDQRLLERHLAADPRNLYSHFKLLELARFWGDAALAKRVAPAARDALEQTDRLHHHRFAGELLVLIANATCARARDALAYLEAHGHCIAASAAFELRRAELYEAIGDFARAREAFAGCLKLEGQLGDLQLSTVRPRMGLARLAIAEGQLDDAVALTKAALQVAPADPEATLAWSMLRSR